MVCIGTVRVTGSGTGGLGSFRAFGERIRAEFVEGSAIAPDVYGLATRLLADGGSDWGHEALYPIHEALNWTTVVRFGRSARPSMAAIALENSDGTVWQLKLSTPRRDRAGGKVYKYETPKGNGARGFFPAVPLRIWGAIAARAGLTVPEGAQPTDFWPWVVAHPTVDVVVTEGGKKALALLSEGHCAIALYGVHGGHRRRDALKRPLEGGPELIEDLRPFAGAGRAIQLAFDQDSHPRARSRVAAAITGLGKLLADRGCRVSVLTWPMELGKGIDDVIVAIAAQTTQTVQAINQGPEGDPQGAIADLGTGEDIPEGTRPQSLGQIFAEAMDLEAWQCWQQLQGRLTYRADWLIPGGDLGDQDWAGLWEQVARSRRPIVAIASPKGTGKTKCLARWLAARGKTALLGHRIALMRNLCDRVGATYRGDLDRQTWHRNIQAGDAFSLRVGLCVDSLLALDPEVFQGCTLVLDEVVQVLRHLLLSATCRDRRSAILARFQTLIRGAALVLVADADLDDSSLNYLQRLRSGPDEEAQVILVRNGGTPLGYGGEFLVAPNDGAAIARLLAAASAGEKLFVATDSKRSSQRLNRLLEQLEQLQVPVLLINGDTSNGPVEQQFARSPDAVLATLQPQVVIATPSLATGVSIESTYFDHVFGLFYGVSITDGDMAQALGRVRPPVPRVVWCRERGQGGRDRGWSGSPQEIRQMLKRRTDATAALLQQQLMAVGVEDLGDRVDWDQSPHVQLWAETVAARRFSLDHLRAALWVRLRYEGNDLAWVDCRDRQNPEVQALIQQARLALKNAEATAIAATPLPTARDLQEWARAEHLTPAQRWAIAKYDLVTFYGVEPAAITPEFVLADRQGQQRQEILALEGLLDRAIARHHDLNTITHQVHRGDPLSPWDFGQALLASEVRDRLGLRAFLEPGREWTKYDLKPLVDRVRAHRRDVKMVVGFDPSPNLHDVDIWHRLLRQLGLRCQFRWERRDGEKLRVYRLDRDRWQQLQAILQRRQAIRPPAHPLGSPTPPELKSSIHPVGDPPPEPPNQQASPRSRASTDPTAAPKLRDRPCSGPRGERNGPAGTSPQSNSCGHSPAEDAGLRDSQRPDRHP
jgi:hypothetical protein